MAVMIHKNQILSPDNGKYKYISTMLYKNRWIDNHYSFEDVYPPSRYNVCIEPNGDIISHELYEEWCRCGIVGSLTGNRCIAMNQIPEENIPIILGYYKITDIGSDTPFSLYPTPSGDIPITSVRLIPFNLTFKKDDFAPIAAVTIPENATETATYSFTIADTEIVEFREDYDNTEYMRMIKAKLAGTTTISVTATTSGGHTYNSSCEVTVYGQDTLRPPENLDWAGNGTNDDVVAIWDPSPHAESYEIEVAYVYEGSVITGQDTTTNTNLDCTGLINHLIYMFPYPERAKQYGDGAYFKVRAIAHDYNNSRWSVESRLSSYRGD